MKKKEREESEEIGNALVVQAKERDIFPPSSSNLRLFFNSFFSFFPSLSLSLSYLFTILVFAGFRPLCQCVCVYVFVCHSLERRKGKKQKIRTCAKKEGRRSKRRHFLSFLSLITPPPSSPACPSRTASPGPKGRGERLPRTRRRRCTCFFVILCDFFPIKGKKGKK